MPHHVFAPEGLIFVPNRLRLCRGTVMSLCSSVLIGFCPHCVLVLARWAMKRCNIGGPECDLPSHFGSTGGMARKHTAGVPLTHTQTYTQSECSSSVTTTENHNTGVAGLPLHRGYFSLLRFCMRLKYCFRYEPTS